MWRFASALSALSVLALISGTAYADPPPWAPAHGARAKGKGHDREVIVVQRPMYAAPYGIASSQCNRDEIGAILGGVAGAAAGSTIGKGDGKVAAVIAGGVIGILVGGAIDQSMDQVDQNCAGQILEYAQDNQRVIWTGPRNASYELRPARSWRTAQGLYCREYQTVALIGGRKQQVFGTACRASDGAWRLAS